MNQKDGFRHGLRPKKISDCLKDRDEELSFFRDIQKRGKEQPSLLQPVPDEFDANIGNYGLHKMESIGRKGAGLEFLGEATAKNDYNWLKTPPATPLFPSLEMETNGQEMITQKEIPIIQPLSRFAGKDKSANTIRSNSTNSNLKLQNIVPPRYKTLNAARPTNISLADKKTLNQLHQTKSSAIPVPKSNNITKTTEMVMEETKPNNNFLASNLTKSMLKPSSTTTSNPKRRGLSPCVRPRIAAQIKGFSNETPENLRTTNRPESASRGSWASIKQQADISTKARGRQSCSPSVTRGRKTEADGYKVSQQTGNGTQVLGSRMVEKLMNARISNAEQRQGKIKMDEKSSSDERVVRKINLHERPGLGMLPNTSLGISSRNKLCH